MSHSAQQCVLCLPRVQPCMLGHSRDIRTNDSGKTFCPRNRERIKAAEAVLFVTPEYKSFGSCGLEERLGIGSKPYGHSAWSGKPGAVVSASPRDIGGIRANHHLRQSLVFLNVLLLRSRKLILATPTSSLTRRANLPTMKRASFCKASSRHLARGSRQTPNYRRHLWFNAF